MILHIFRIFRTRGLWLFVLLLAGSVWLAWGQQSKAALETRRKLLYRELDVAQKLLRSTQSDKAASVNDIVLLDKKIDTRTEIINDMATELEVLDISISNNTGKIDSLGAKIKQLKEDYARMVRQTYLSQNTYSRLLFLFSAKDFNDAYSRLKYLQYYREYRKNQLDAIEAGRHELLEKSAKLNEEKKEKLSLFEHQKAEQQLLEDEKKNKNSILGLIKQREKKLRSTLKQKQQAIGDLNRQIQEIIAAATRSSEMPTATKEAGVRKAPKDPENLKLSANFAQNKGLLIWPVEEGVITGYFGTHSHPVFKNLVTTNNGIDISTQPDANVRAIFDGKVINMLYNPSFQWAVIVKHGDYFSVYSHLKEVFVAKGDKIAMKKVIGTAYTSDEENKTEVHLEIWEGANKVNPAKWLRQN